MVDRAQRDDGVHGGAVSSRALPRWLEKVVRAHELDVEPRLFAATVAAVRVAFGLGLVHRFVAIYGFAALAEDPDGARLQALFGAGLGLAVALGALTPVALAMVVWFTYVDPRFVHCLGNQAGCIVAWALLLSGAGRCFAIDAALLRWRPAAPLVRRCYVLATGSAPRDLAWVRLFTMTMYWGIGFSAMAFHFDDPLWLRGEVLQLVMVTPYLTDHYQAFTAFRDAMPRVFDVVMTVGLAVQATWEMLLVPLMLFRVGRWFVAVQGLLFFVFSGMALNLGYLPFNELCLWFLWFPVFALPPLQRSLARLLPADAAGGRAPARSTVGIGERGLRRLTLCCAVVVLVQTALNTATVAGQPWAADAIAAGGQVWFRGKRVFAQEAVNVFNRTDLGMGAVHVVVCETDGDGRVLRVVPVADGEGGRLDRLRNDLLYFGRSLLWRRTPPSAKFDEVGGEVRVSSATAAYVRQLVELDAALTDGVAPRCYRALLMTRDIVRSGRHEAWGPPREVAAMALRLDDAELRRIRSRADPAFWLPPGHQGSARRAAATLDDLRAR